MPRRLGWKCSEEVRANMRAGALSRQSRIIQRYGLTAEFYAEQIASGKLWCSTCKQFVDSDLMASAKTKCLACQRVHNRANYANNREARNKKRTEHFFRNRESELVKRRNRSLGGYGVTVEWYETTLREQGGGCAICGGKDDFERMFAIDHDHECCPTKRACDKCRRGLLCTRCNTAFERIDTVPAWTKRAEDYARKHGAVIW